MFIRKKNYAQTGNRTRVNSMASYYSTTRPFVLPLFLTILIVLYNLGKLSLCPKLVVLKILIENIFD